MRRGLPAALLLTGLITGGLGAQQQRLVLELSRGTEVRIETRDVPGRRIVGRVVSSTPDSLAVETRGSGEPFAVHLPALATLEVRGGLDRQRGVLIGAAVGAGLAVVFGGIDAARGDTGAGEVASIAAGNALIFGLVGYAFAPKGWERLPLP